MLLVSRRLSCAVHIPVLVWVGAAGFGGLALHLVGPTPWQAVPAALLAAGLVLLALSETRFVAPRGYELVLRSAVGRRRQLDRAACAFGVRRFVGRSAAYTVYATDGRSSFDLFNLRSLPRADRAVARLSAAFGAEEAQAGSITARASGRARAHIAKVRASWERDDAKTKATIDAYYRSPTHRRKGRAILVGMVIYLLVMSALVLSHGW
jgi:hypothetical protein